MKKTFTLLLSSVIAVSAFAQYGQTVTITLAGNGPANSRGNNNDIRAREVVIDGRVYSNDYNTGKDRNRITINNLPTGQHSLVINGSQQNNGGKYGNNRYPSTQAPYTGSFVIKQGYDLNIQVKPNGEVTYRDKKANNNNQGRYGNGPADRRGRDDDHDRNDNGSWKNNREGNHDRKHDDDDDDRRNNGGYGRNNGGYGRNDNGGYGRNDNGGYGRNDNGGYGRNNGGYGRNNSRYSAMSDADFNDIYQGVKGKWFQSGKVSAIKTAFENTAYYFSTYQVRQLLQLINAESSKLDLAKQSYAKVVDRNNFTRLYDLFSSQSSRDELDNYIRGSRY